MHQVFLFCCIFTGYHLVRVPNAGDSSASMFHSSIPCWLVPISQLSALLCNASNDGGSCTSTRGRLSQTSCLQTWLDFYSGLVACWSLWYSLRKDHTENTLVAADRTENTTSSCSSIVVCNHGHSHVTSTEQPMCLQSHSEVMAISAGFVIPALSRHVPVFWYDAWKPE
jgi:hypothetical protein